MVEKKNALNLDSEVLANETNGEKEHLERLGRYAQAKQHQVNVADYILQHEPKMTRELSVLEECSKTLIFRHWHTVGVYRLIGGCTCKKHLLCAMCALRRSAKMVMQIHQKIKTVLAENPDLVPVLLTLTVKNEDDLAERYIHITGAKKKLLHARRNAKTGGSNRTKNKSVMRYIHGSVGSYEFKRGQGGHGWHPHSHEIALLSPGLEYTKVTVKGKEVESPLEFQAELSREWLKLTSDSFVVDVRKLQADNDEELIKGICEASKYALKMNSMEVEDQIAAYKILKGRRLTFSYGSLWGIKVPDDMADTIEDELKLLPYVDLVYGFYKGEYRHTSTSDFGDLFAPTKQKEEVHRRQVVDLKYSEQVAEYVSKLRVRDEYESERAT